MIEFFFVSLYLYPVYYHLLWHILAKANMKIKISQNKASNT